MAVSQGLVYAFLLVAAGTRPVLALQKGLEGPPAHVGARLAAGAAGIRLEAAAPILQGCDGFDCVLRFIARPDQSYAWRDTGARIHGKDAGTGVRWTGYVLNMTSQAWLTTALIDFPLWWHIMVVVVPENRDEAVDWATVTLDFGVDDGRGHLARVDNRVPTGIPSTGDALVETIIDRLSGTLSITAENLQSHIADLEAAAYKAAYIATRTRAIGTSLLDLPNAYETFKDDPFLLRRASDVLKGYTYGNFLEHPDEPERIMDLPVAKAAVRAIDTVQAFCAHELGFSVTRFGVAGYSKLGTATWLTGAADTRVKAIVPVAISMSWYDNLGIPEPPPSQQTAEVKRIINRWNPYAEVANNPYTAQLNKMTKIIDPVSFLDRLTIPKLLVMAASDSVVFGPSGFPEQYLPKMLGPTAFLEIPDCAHQDSLIKALPSAAAFFRGVVLGKSAPRVAHAFDNATGTITARQVSDDVPTAVRLWTGPPSPMFLAMLSGPYTTGTQTWASVQLQETSPGSRSWATGPLPTDGRYRARFVSFEYEWPQPGTAFQISTPSWSVELHL